MTDAQVGRVFRAVRHRLRMRQEDVGRRARVSRQVVSRIERGRLEEVSVRSLRRIGDALGVDTSLLARWRGGELDRLLNARHAGMHESALAFLDRFDGWTFVSEASFAIRGERGIVDLLGWHPERRALLIGEWKSDIVDPGELVGTMDKRERLAREIAATHGWEPQVIGLWVAVEEGRTNRRHLARSRRLLRGAFPRDGRALRAWLGDPASPIRALSFLPSARQASPRHRVRRPRRSGC